MTLVSKPISNVSDTTGNAKPIKFQPQFDRLDLALLGALALISFLLFLPLLGTAGMFDPTDSFFLESTREMVQTKEFAVPLINYELWLDKPACAFWLIILSYKLFGINEFAGRLPSAVSGILLVVTTFSLSRQMLSRRQAFFSALVLACSPLFLIVGHVALIDEPMALFLTTALLSIAVFIARRSLPFLLLGYFALSLAALTKGPIALVLVGLITCGYFLFTQPRKILQSIWSLKPLLALALLLVLVAPYYLWAHIDTHGEFTKAFFLRQNLGRMVGAVNHVSPAWWYIPVLLGGFFPWSLVALSSGRYLRYFWVRRSRLLTARQSLVIFSICWTVLGFTFFSAIPTKLQTYIVPIFPGLAIVMGVYLDLLLRSKRLAPVMVAGGAISLMCACAPLAVHMLSSGSGLLTWIAYGSSASVAIALLISLIIFRNNGCRIMTAVFSGTGIAYGLFIPLLFCMYHDKYQVNIDKVVHYALEKKAHLG